MPRRTSSSRVRRAGSPVPPQGPAEIGGRIGSAAPAPCDPAPPGQRGSAGRPPHGRQLFQDRVQAVEPVPSREARAPAPAGLRRSPGCPALRVGRSAPAASWRPGPVAGSGRPQPPDAVRPRETGPTGARLQPASKMPNASAPARAACLPAAAITRTASRQAGTRSDARRNARRLRQRLPGPAGQQVLPLEPSAGRTVPCSPGAGPAAPPTLPPTPGRQPGPRRKRGRRKGTVLRRGPHAAAAVDHFGIEHAVPDRLNGPARRRGSRTRRCKRRPASSRRRRTRRPAPASRQRQGRIQRVQEPAVGSGRFHPAVVGETGQQGAVGILVRLEVVAHRAGVVPRVRERFRAGRSSRRVAPSRFPCRVMATRLSAGQ